MSVQRRVFPESFKREAVDRVANSGLTAGAVARELGLNRKYSHTAWRIKSAGKRWRLNEIGFTKHHPRQRFRPP